MYRVSESRKFFKFPVCALYQILGMWVAWAGMGSVAPEGVQVLMERHV